MEKAAEGRRTPRRCRAELRPIPHPNVCGQTSYKVGNSVEMAYFTFPGFEKRGIATGMAQGLVAIARKCDPSVKIIAHTLAEENASNHILKKVGFVLSGTIDHPEDGKIWEWSL